MTARFVSPRLGQVLLAGSAVVLAIGLSITATRAVAAYEAVLMPAVGHIALQSHPLPAQWRDVRAGDTVHWTITASLGGVSRSDLGLELRADGRLVDTGRMHVAVRTCTDAYRAGDLSKPNPEAPVCPGAERTIVPTTSLAESTELNSTGDGLVHPLAELQRGAPRHVLVTVGVDRDADPAEYAGASAHVAVGLHASGDDAAPGTLPVTGGAGDLIALTATALGAAGVAAGLALHSRARASRHAVPPDGRVPA